MICNHIYMPSMKGGYVCQLCEKDIDSETRDELTAMRTLLIQHGTHWRAVAGELGGICCGGVDGPVSDPSSTAGAIVEAIQKITAERDELAYRVSECEAHFAEARAAGMAEMLATVKRLMEEADMAHREYDETWEHFESAIKDLSEPHPTV